MKKEYLTVNQIADQYGFSVHTVRWWMSAASEENSLKDMIIKIGSRRYVERGDFEKWIESMKACNKNKE